MLLAIGMRDRAGHAGDVEIAGEQADPRRIRQERQRAARVLVF